MFNFRIQDYDTVSTDDSVLIIGGATGGSGTIAYELSVVAEYKDGSWSNIGNLARPRHNFRATKFGSKIMILGGNENNTGPSAADPL